MKKITTLLILALLGTQVGCTTGKGLGEKDDIWYSDQINILGLFTFADVYYCKNNKEASGLVRPVCYKAKLLSPSGN